MIGVNKGYWHFLYDDFLRSNPLVDEREIECWDLSDELEITVWMKDGSRYIHDKLYDTTRYEPHPKYGWEMDEAEWRRAFARKLLRCMDVKGITQRELSEITGITVLSIWKYVNGEVLPGSYNLAKIARVLGCSVDHLVGF